VGSAHIVRVHGSHKFMQVGARKLVRPLCAAAQVEDCVVLRAAGHSRALIHYLTGLKQAQHMSEYKEGGRKGSTTEANQTVH